MDQQKKLYIGIAALAVLGGLLVFQRQGAQQDFDAHSLEGQTASLPKLDLGDEKVDAIDRVVLHKPAESDAGAPSEIVLTKTGEEAWSLSAPIEAKANASSVKSLVDNLKKLSLTERISDSTEEYERWGVSDGKALHASFFKGEESVFDVYFGDNGSRGQMTRIAGQDGVFSVKGFSKWLYERDAKGFRDKSMFKFDDKEVVKVSIDNESGSFLFTKSGDAWVGEYGKKASSRKALEGFKPSKVDDLLRAYKGLSAMDFGDGKQPADVGLEEPAATVSIELTGGKALHVLKVGGTADGSNRWALTNGSDSIYAISSWSADWATAAPSKFQAEPETPEDD